MHLNWGNFSQTNTTNKLSGKETIQQAQSFKQNNLMVQNRKFSFSGQHLVAATWTNHCPWNILIRIFPIYFKIYINTCFLPFQSHFHIGHLHICFLLLWVLSKTRTKIMNKIWGHLYRKSICRNKKYWKQQILTKCMSLAEYIIADR